MRREGERDEERKEGSGGRYRRFQDVLDELEEGGMREEGV